MKHLKKFENFEFGRFNDEDEIKDNDLTNDFDDNEFDDFTDEVDTDDVCEICGASQCECVEDDIEDEDESDEDNRVRRWGDEEIVEKKKVNPGFQAYLDKQKAKNSKKKDGDDDKDKKDDKKDAPKGLSAKQKKLPQAMQDAILKRMKK